MKEFVEKLIGRLEEAKERANRHYNYGDETAYRHSIEIVNQLAEEYNNGWIPCSERLPELFETYIVTIKMKYEWEKEWEYHVDVADYTCDDAYIDGAWNTFNDWCEGQECHVIAWQPLPAPYQPKGE